ncbi:hypothetical protein [Mammaliicoccus lentus]|uniref:hypothetical protein n=1 Tax=Mammaliicoccus lentus TaxID=42858 RepID=UPI0010721DD1|nr:hypothetical protein [Mammaliicoccus lentus]MBF0749192.1 hypothetical protein [Mammaliicoccus lentus]TFU57870.1 hypothetical protein E4T93_07240 [Mammaliicoccus lentus]
MKKLLIAALSIVFLLGACSQKEENSTKKENTKKTESKDTKKDDEKKDKSEKENKDKESAEKSESKAEEQSTEEGINEEIKTTEEVMTNKDSKENKNLNYNNVTDRNSLVEIIYGNYAEEQKIIAYNSAVTNGVIPQGNVMEGPASAAYESSLRVESGKEKSIYDEIPDIEEKTHDYENNGVYRTPKEQEAHEDWVNGQDEWNNASESEKEEIRKRDAEKYGYEYDPSDYE